MTLEKIWNKVVRLTRRVCCLSDRVTALEEGGGGGGDFIPLAGTTVGNPVTGTVKWASTGPPYLYPFTLIEQQDDDADVKFKAFRDEGGAFNIRQDVISDSENNYSQLSFSSSYVQLYNKSLGHNRVFSISASGFDLGDSNPLSKGLRGSVNFMTNLTAADSLVYTQKIYVDKQHSYSTTEQVTGGTWINGKPIYRKSYTASVSGVSQVIATSVTDIEHVINQKGYLDRFGAGEEFIQLPFVSSGPLNSSVIRINSVEVLDNEIRLTNQIATYDAAGNQLTSNTAYGGTYYITIEYTKTTDV